MGLESRVNCACLMLRRPVCVKRLAVSGVPRGDHTVKHVNPQCNALRRYLPEIPGP